MITPNYKAVNFAKEIRGRRLNGSVIREVEVASEGSCRLQCVEEDGCLSYNFGPSENKKRFKCQLSDSDRFSACETDSSPCGDKGVCIPNYQDGSVECKCDDGYTGKPCKLVPTGCVQLLQDGFTSSGVYTINPDGGKPIQVLCDMTTDGGGWIVFQRRLDGSVDFYLGWESYKNGFGDLNGEFWLGNDNLHRLTAADDVMLRVDLEDFDGDIRYAGYTTFKVADEGDRYRLLIGGYSGTAGDSGWGLLLKRLRKQTHPWLDSSVLHLMRQRDHLHKKAIKHGLSTDWNEYKRLRNMVTCINRKRRKNFFANKLEENRGNPKAYWRTLRQILPSKSKISGTKKLFVEEIELNGELDIANSCNEYFTNVASTLLENRPSPEIQQPVPQSQTPSQIFSLPIINEWDMFKALRTLNHTKELAQTTFQRKL
ncbi:hypothetical protein ACROYT_G004315 [Oculina patagonica]